MSERMSRVTIKTGNSGIKRLERCALLSVLNHHCEGYVDDSSTNTMYQPRTLPHTTDDVSPSNDRPFLTDMKTHFSPHHRVALLGLSLVSSALLSLSAHNIKANVAGLVAQYQDDLQCPRHVATQFHSWKLKWEEKAKQHGKACLPVSPSEALPHATSLFPDIRIVLQILCTLPVASCTNQRSHNSLKRIKTYLRSTRSNEQLSALALMLIHQDVPADPMTVVVEFACRHPRRMQLTTFK